MKWLEQRKITGGYYAREYIGGVATPPIYSLTTRRQPFLWKKALNDDDVFGYTKIICHADKLFLLIRKDAQSYTNHGSIARFVTNCCLATNHFAVSTAITTRFITYDSWT